MHFPGGNKFRSGYRILYNEFENYTGTSIWKHAEKFHNMVVSEPSTNPKVLYWCRFYVISWSCFEEKMLDDLGPVSFIKIYAFGQILKWGIVS